MKKQFFPEIWKLITENNREAKAKACKLIDEFDQSLDLVCQELQELKDALRK